MTTYHKIDSLYKRDEKGKFTAEYACEEFLYLQSTQWEWTEKVDGTNIRLYYPGPQDAAFVGNEHAYIQGRTDNAQIPPKLLRVLVDLMKNMPLGEVFTGPVVLYGEGYGPGIQKGGGLYGDTPSFVLFDVKIGDWWLKREDVDGIAAKLGIRSVPVIGRGTLEEAELFVRDGFTSERWPRSRPEGLVLRPTVELFNRGGHRIITKIKVRDFE
jgi:hypothetical protein